MDPQGKLVPLDGMKTIPLKGGPLGIKPTMPRRLA